LCGADNISHSNCFTFRPAPTSFIPNQTHPTTRGCWRQALGTRYRSRIEGLRSHSPPRCCEGTGRTEDVIHDAILIPIDTPRLKSWLDLDSSIPQIHKLTPSPTPPLLLPPRLLFCSSTSPDILLSGNLFLISAHFDGKFVIATWPLLTNSLCGLPLSGPFR
jgi:hypothetical protein